MFITDQFIMLNFPKTGSSFAREALRKIYKERAKRDSLLSRLKIFAGLREPIYQELMFKNIKKGGVDSTKSNQHGTYSQIPEKYRDRDIFSIARNPVDRFVSAYQFQWWVKRPPLHKELMDKYFPDFPDLTIEDYFELEQYTMVHSRLGGVEPATKVGNQTVLFLQMYATKPRELLSKICRKNIELSEIMSYMPPITFLRQESLRQDLIDFLRGYDFSEDELKIIMEHDRVNVTDTQNSENNRQISRDLKSKIYQTEEIMIKILRNYGVEYAISKTA